MKSSGIKISLSKITPSLLIMLMSCGVVFSQPVVEVDVNNADDLEKPPSMMPSVVDIHTPNEGIELLPISAVEPTPLPLKNSPIESLEYKLSKPLLDLELPFKVSNDPVVQDLLMPLSATDIFTQNKAKKTRAIRLDGMVLMTDEQETEKRKSLDGAGIAINIKP